jgi:hypothetical protein
VACSGNHIRGEISGYEVIPKSAFFFAQQDAFGDDSLIGVVLSTLKTGCEDYGFYHTAAAGMDGPAELASAWGAVFPPDFWEVAIVMRTGDPAAELTGQVYSGTAWDAPLDNRGEAYVRATQNHRLRDETFYNGGGVAAEYYTDHLSNAGDLEITSHQPGQKLNGTFGTGFVLASDGSASGIVNISFKAVFCPEADLL